jgi:hypothetical protein
MNCDSNERSFLVRFFDSFLQERNIKWMLGLGMLILFGSSVKLISTHWTETSAAWKHVILLAFTALIAVMANQCFWRLGLRKTGTVLMALTVLLLPVTFLAWHAVWAATTNVTWSAAVNLLLLAVNLIAGWMMASSIFQHLLRGRQQTFVVCYLLLAAAGACVPQLPDAWPATALALWGLMTVGTIKVHRHVFWLTEERRLPRIFGFFPIALLGTQFLLLFAFYLVPGIPWQWLGLACVLLAAPVLSTGDAAAQVYRQRTGNLVRPIPAAIIMPMFAGLTLCAVGLCLSGTEFPRPTALVPTAAIVAGLMAVTAHRTNKAAFAWVMLLCAVVAYNFSYVFFMNLARLVVQQGAHAVHEQRLPYAFYGLTYLPFLIVLTMAAAWAGRRGNEVFAGPGRRFAVGLSCLLLAAAFQHPKAVFPVSAAMVGIFALQIRLFRKGPLLYPAIAAFIGASFGLSIFATDVCGFGVLPDMRLACLATAALALLFPGVLIDRWVERIQTAAADGDVSPLYPVCRRASLGLTLLLLAIWCGTAFNSAVPAELAVSEGLLLLLAVLHALVWRNKRLAEISLAFAGFGAVIHATNRGMPASEIISAGTVILFLVWLGSYVLLRRNEKRVGFVFGPATRNIGGVCLTLLLMFYYLPWLAWGTLTGAQQMAWPCQLLIVCWAFDAARRLASPVHTILGCVGTIGLSTAGVTEILGVEASREWLLATWGAVALAGTLPAVWLSRRRGLCELSSRAVPQDERRRAVDSALAAPLHVVVLGSLLVVAAVSTAVFSVPARVAGATAIAGLVCLGFRRRESASRTVALISLNWQLLSVLVELNAPGVTAALPISEMWLIPSSLPLALAAAASAWAFVRLAERPQQELVRALIPAHMLLMHGVTGGALLASLGHLPLGLAPQQTAMAAMTFTIVIIGNLRQACRVQDVMRVWIAEALSGVAFAYFVLFGVIQLGSGAAPLILLGTGLALWSAGQAAALHSSIVILSQPFRQTGMVLPMAAVVLAAGRHLAGMTTTMLGVNSLVLLGAAAFYFWNGLEQRRRGLVVLSAVILNGALALLWSELSWTDPQLFLIPLGLSVLGLVELLQGEIPRPMHNPLRYAGGLVILVSPTFHIMTGSWVHLFTLMAASVAVTLLSIGIRVRALMYTGVAFLIADLLAMLVRGSIDRPNVLWIAGIGLGTAVLILGALCENRREILMQRLRILTAELETWR